MQADSVMRVLDTFVGDYDQVISVQRGSLNATIDGIAADRHFGHYKKAGVREQKFHQKGTLIFNARQWSAVSAEELVEIARAMAVPEIKAEWLGANLLLCNDAPSTLIGQQIANPVRNFTKLPGLTRLVFEGGAVLLVYSENLPCKYPANAMIAADPETFSEKAKFFGQAALGKRGLVGWVERAGIITPGQTVKIYLPT